ncbi:MAG: hypothetical protein AMJ56_06855 [Anaerolineae bacterium SG8_19]|nr:MAG: hypothetical protein AMJ56_06855 [Anaerolineae bacterium SG8_19]
MDKLSQKTVNETESTGTLLSPQERLVCEQLTAGQPPFSQRALSLLAIDAGATQTAAAQQSGQTVGQVRYWLSKFRKNRMGIFPGELLPQSEPEPPLSQQLPDQPPVPESLALDQPVKQDKVGEESNGTTAEVKPVRKGKGKIKKKSKKIKASKGATEKAQEKKKQKKAKKGKRKQDKKKPSGKKQGKKKKG